MIHRVCHREELPICHLWLQLDFHPLHKWFPSCPGPRLTPAYLAVERQTVPRAGFVTGSPSFHDQNGGLLRVGARCSFCKHQAQTQHPAALNGQDRRCCRPTASSDHSRPFPGLVLFLGPRIRFCQKQRRARRLRPVGKPRGCRQGYLDSEHHCGPHPTGGSSLVPPRDPDRQHLPRGSGRCGRRATARHRRFYLFNK